MVVLCRNLRGQDLGVVRAKSQRDEAQVATLRRERGQHACMQRSDLTGFILQYSRLTFVRQPAVPYNCR